MSSRPASQDIQQDLSKKQANKGHMSASVWNVGQHGSGCVALLCIQCSSVFMCHDFRPSDIKSSILLSLLDGRKKGIVKVEFKYLECHFLEVHRNFNDPSTVAAN